MCFKDEVDGQCRGPLAQSNKKQGMVAAVALAKWVYPTLPSLASSSSKVLTNKGKFPKGEETTFAFRTKQREEKQILSFCDPKNKRIPEEKAKSKLHTYLHDGLCGKNRMEYEDISNE